MSAMERARSATALTRGSGVDEEGVVGAEEMGGADVVAGGAEVAAGGGRVVVVVRLVLLVVIRDKVSTGQQNRT